jgi:hypothetical protein
MYSATVQPEDFDTSPWDNPFEEHKLGVGNVRNFSKQITNAVQTLKFLSTKFSLDENVQSAVKLLYVTLFHFQKSLSSLPIVCKKSCAVGTANTVHVFH